MSTGHAATSGQSPSFKRAFARLVDLVSLQGRLIVADAREGAAAARISISLWICSGAMAFAAGPLLLAAAAVALRDGMAIPLSLALLLSSLAGAIAAAALGFLAWKLGRRGVAVAVRSFDDFEKNLRALAPADGGTSE